LLQLGEEKGALSGRGCGGCRRFNGRAIRQPIDARGAQTVQVLADLSGYLIG
jgi:hypothetical protein